jgi:hypothetical protein
MDDSSMLGTSSLRPPTGGAYLHANPAPICSTEKLASVTTVFPLVRFPELVTMRLANGESHRLRAARKS